MATYDYAQLEELWIQAGGSKALAPLMAAIAMAESQGNSEAQNPSGAAGLWQILGAPNGWTGPTDWLNPQVNAQAAVAKYNTQGLSAWTTYTSGAYKKFLKGNVPASAQLTGTSPSQQQGQQGLEQWLGWVPGLGVPLQFMTGSANGIGDVANAVSDVGRVFSELVTWISWLFVPNHWIRIICFVLGVPLVGMGIHTMATGSLYSGFQQQMVSSAQSQGAPLPSGSVGSLGPAIGIAEVTVGAVLLFVAFHNLPDNVQTFPQLLSHLQSKVQSGVTSKEGPGPRTQVI